MRLKEQRLWDRMRKNMPPAVFLGRMENTAGDGWPDVWAAVDGAVTPIELKAVDFPPARPATRLIPSGDGLSVVQRNWHMEWAKRKCRSLILVSVGKGQRIHHYIARLDTFGDYDNVNQWPQNKWSENSMVGSVNGSDFWNDVATILSWKQ